MRPTKASLLREVRALLAEEARWTKRVSAYDENRKRLIMRGEGWARLNDAQNEFPGDWHKSEDVPFHGRPACFCLVGAVHQVLIDAKLLGKANGFLITDLEKTLFRRGLFDNVAVFNDEPRTSHADVLRLLDETIKRLEKGT